MSSVIAGGKLLVSTWTSGLDAVNAVLLAASTQAEYMRDPGVNGATDIVYTMPTKPLAVTTGAATPPFGKPLEGSGACELALDVPFSREERLVNRPWNFPDLVHFAGLCWTTTVQSVTTVWPAATPVAGSRAGMKRIGGTPVFDPVVPFENGVFDMVLSEPSLPERVMRPTGTTRVTDLGSGAQSTSSNVSYRGLPVIGVTMIRYTNGTLDVGGRRTLSNYGAGSTLRTFPDVTAQ